MTINRGGSGASRRGLAFDAAGLEPRTRFAPHGDFEDEAKERKRREDQARELEREAEEIQRREHGVPESRKLPSLRRGEPSSRAPRGVAGFTRWPVVPPTFTVEGARRAGALSFHVHSICAREVTTC